MTKKEYNGWTNYETWAVNLWLENEEPSYRYWTAMARSCARQHSTKHDKSTYSEAALALANAIKDHHEEKAPEQLHGTVFADLLTGALAEVNWREIAESWIDNATE